MKSSLEILPTKIVIPKSVYTHKHYKEASALVSVLEKLDKPSKVSGTANNKTAELYGWLNPVKSHIDSYPDRGNSWVYFCILSGEASIFSHSSEVTKSEYTTYVDEFTTTICPEIGQIVRLDDKKQHGTTGTGECVALFIGTFHKTCDTAIVKQMQLAVDQLAAGHDAPRLPSIYVQAFEGKI